MRECFRRVNTSLDPIMSGNMLMRTPWSWIQCYRKQLLDLNLTWERTYLEVDNWLEVRVRS